MIPLSSSDLEHAAGVAQRLLGARRNARLQVEDRLDAGFLLLTGPTATVGLRRALDILSNADRADAQLNTVARILLLSAKANREIEQWLQRMYDLNLVTPAVILLARQLGARLDTMCAATIDRLTALCTSQDMGASPEKDNQQPQNSGETLSGGDPLVSEHHLLDPAFTFGEIDAPKHIITVVPGVGSSTPSGQLSTLTKAAALHQGTEATVVAWQGYTAPANLAAGLATQPAQVGAEALTHYQRELRRQYPDATLTVVGHSYGSVVAGYAAPEGLEADTLVLAGSPGVPRAALQHHNIMSVLGGRDPIGLTGTTMGAIHGIDPHALNSGARTYWLRGDHGGYFTDPKFHELLKQAAQAEVRPER